MSENTNTDTTYVPESRVKKTLLNTKVNMLFYFLTLLITFFSRKIFLDNLSPAFVGLTGTLGNILGYLNLVELGVGAAIAFNLYKPLQERNHEKLNDLISLFGYYYRNIGLVVLGAGIVISLFFPIIFKDQEFSFLLIYFAFYSFLGSTLLGYFVNYRTTILNADQRGYTMTAYFAICSYVKTFLQMWLAYNYCNFYLYIAIEFSVGLLNVYMLNRKVSKLYPWLEVSVKRGKEVAKDYPNIMKSTKQVFVHKIKDFMLTQSDQLFIFLFVKSLSVVAYYGNYVLVISRLMGFFNGVYGGVHASIGNLVAEGNKPRMLHVFWELMALRYFVAGFSCFCVFFLIDPFICNWLGSEYVLGTSIVTALVVYEFISASRGTVDMFNFAFGHYGDVWAAWLEGILNITFIFIFASQYGIVGILMGKLCSVIPIVVFWKPLYLFKDGFKASYKMYWQKTLRYYLALITAGVPTVFVLKLVPIDPATSFYNWVIYASICAGLFGLLYGGLIYAACPGGRDLINRLPLHKIGLRPARA